MCIQVDVAEGPVTFARSLGVFKAAWGGRRAYNTRQQPLVPYLPAATSRLRVPYLTLLRKVRYLASSCPLRLCREPL